MGIRKLLMMNSQFLACDETCFTELPKTPFKVTSKELLQTPPQTRKRTNLNLDSTASGGCPVRASTQVTANNGFWLRFDQHSDSESEECLSEKSFLSSESEEVNDDFFEFEIDENGNWSSVESQISQNEDSDDEDSIDCDSLSKDSIQIDLFKKNQPNFKEMKIQSQTNKEIQLDSKEKDKKIFKNKLITGTVFKEEIKNSKDVLTKKVSSLKLIRENGLVNSFKNL